MKIEDIRHRGTIDSIRKNNIDISLCNNLDDIRKQIRCLKLKKYRDTHKEYFRDYMYNYMHGRYGMKKNLEWIRELPNV
jgi:hypothetical protein